MNILAPAVIILSATLAPVNMVGTCTVTVENSAETDRTAYAEPDAPFETELVAKAEKDYSQVEPESDLWLIAKVICGEAQNCDRTEMEYVASVILNRVADPRFPDTVSGVVYQDNPVQYQCTRDGNWYKTPTQANWEEAEYVLNMFNTCGYTCLPGNVLYQSKCPLGSGTYTVTAWGHYYSYG